MPYSFTQIEKEKTSTIQLVFIFLILVYFFTIFGIVLLAEVFYIAQASDAPFYRIQPFSLSRLSFIFAAAVVIGALHWAISIHNLIPKMIKTLGGRALDPGDSYHQMLRNIVDEVSVATGGKKMEAVVVPVTAMNAFALADFEGRSVIGVTEGLLAKLNRAQLEAVVGHEAAHIISGDCLSTTVSISLFGLYNGMLSGLSHFMRSTRRSHSRRGGGIVLYVIVLYLFLQYTRFLSLLINMFISRQRELRADAVAVRLTRDPLALAEALYTISYHWRGAGLSAEDLEAIFIINPKFSMLDERKGLFADLFSTHPPVEQRLHVLLDMAKADVQSLEQKFRSSEERPRQAAVQPVLASAQTLSWMVFQGGEWLGPLTLPAVLALQGIKPDTWVKKTGGDVIPAYADPQISSSLWKKSNAVPAAAAECPRCHVAFGEVYYEGVVIKQCGACGASCVNEDQLQRLIIRHDMGFSDRVVHAGKALQEQQRQHQIEQIDMRSANLWKCPQCPEPRPSMLRSFYTLAYPVEVDRCYRCGYIFFDKDELEILQYLIEANITMNKETR